MNIDEFISHPKLEGVRKSGNGWSALCPAHGDKNSSLSIGEGDNGKILLKCHAGCGIENLVNALDLTKADLFPANGQKKKVRHRVYRSRLKVNPLRSDSADLATGYHGALEPDSDHFKPLVEELHVPLRPLQRLQVGWSDEHAAYTFPMKDAEERTIGFRVRARSGKKWAVKGSRNGLFIPGDTDFGLCERLLVCEGPTDCAALLGLGFAVVGRASCSEGTELLRGFCRIHRPKEVVVVADSDEPGQRGANTLANALCLQVPVVRVICPPEGIKDARAWVIAGGTSENVEQSIEEAPVLQLTVKGRNK